MDFECKHCGKWVEYNSMNQHTESHGLRHYNRNNDYWGFSDFGFTQRLITVLNMGKCWNFGNCGPTVARS